MFEPLDLRAVEAFYLGCGEWNRREARAIEAGDADPAAHGFAVEYGLALLAYARALRAALAHAASSLDHLMAFKGSRLEETQRAGHELNITRARAVLAAAQDGPA